jgi:5-methylcytosine-specific restriction endonuclease McrA
VDKKEPKHRPSCGTYSGRALHMKYKERLCQPCRNAYNAYLRQYRANKPEIISEIKKRQYNKDIEKSHALAKIQRIKHAEKTKAYLKIYNKTQKRKDAFNAKSRRRRSVNSEPYTEQQVLELYGSLCHICNKLIDLLAPRSAQKGNDWHYGLHIDHIIPLAKGGEDTLNNVKPAHAICNLSKGAKLG